MTGTLGLGDLTGGGVLDILTGRSGLLTTLTGLVGVTNCAELTSALGRHVTSGLPLLGGLLNNGGLLGGLLGGLSLPVDGLGGLLSACNAGNFAGTLDLRDRHPRGCGRRRARQPARHAEPALR